MKRIYLTLSIILVFLLSACNANNEADVSSYGMDIAKVQEITVVSADTAEIIKTVTATRDIEAFVSALDLDSWKLKSLPDNPAVIGSFHLAQEETLRQGQSDNDGELYEVAVITLYDGSLLRFELRGLDMSFEVSETAADYLREYFE